MPPRRQARGVHQDMVACAGRRVLGAAESTATRSRALVAARCSAKAGGADPVANSKLADLLRQAKDAGAWPCAEVAPACNTVEERPAFIGSFRVAALLLRAYVHPADRPAPCLPVRVRVCLSCLPGLPRAAPVCLT
jgi:hypothetical protein